jgi:hypothetical protein
MNVCTTRNHRVAGFHTGILIERANLAEQKSAGEEKAAFFAAFLSISPWKEMHYRRLNSFFSMSEAASRESLA